MEKLLNELMGRLCKVCAHRNFFIDKICQVNNMSSSIGCYGVKPDSVGESWMCSRCAEGAWIVVSNHIIFKSGKMILISPGHFLDRTLRKV